MNRLVHRIIHVNLISLMIFLNISCNNNANQEYILRVALWANEDHTWYKAFQHFQTLVHNRSDGRLVIEVYPSEQLAKEMEAIRLIQAGVIDMTVSASLLSNWIEIAAFCEMPFLLRDEREKNALLNGPLGTRIKKEIQTEVGLVPIATFERGPRQLTSNRPIRNPDDLKGLIVRVPSVPSFVTAWAAMGAKPTPMAFSEVFTSLQQGTIEAQENPFALIKSMGFYEVQKYVNVTEHVMSWSYALIGEKQFNRLPGDLQTILLEAAKEMESYEKKLFVQNEAMVKAELLSKGMVFIEVDKGAFSKKCEKAIFSSLSPEMQKVYTEFVNSIRGQEN